MLRACLILGMTVPVWATPVSGDFSFTANSNFANIVGPDFAWQFHQGEAPMVYTQCPTLTCSLDGSAAPAMFAFLNPDNWFLAAASSAEAYANVTGRTPTTAGAIGGSFEWHVDRTDWGDVPVGSQIAISQPMEISGLLTASDGRGVFMDHNLRGWGWFDTEVVRLENGVAFLGASGRFEGDVEPVPEPAAYALAASGLLLLGAALANLRFGGNAVKQLQSRDRKGAEA